MSKNPLFKLAEYGQSVWYDDITRSLVRGDGLRWLMDERAVVGMTTNPSIFGKAIGESDEYDDDLRRLVGRGASPEDIFMHLALDDGGRALDTLKPAYDSSHHVDGRVSMEVLASLAHDTEGTQEMVRDIWKRVSKPNLMVKIPATDAGIPAIEEMLYEGHSINITLIFGLDYYRRVADAYVKANLMVKIPATDAGIPAIEEMLYEGHSINITLIFGLDYYRRVADAYVKA